MPAAAGSPPEPAYEVLLAKSVPPKLPAHVQAPAWVKKRKWVAERDRDLEPSIRTFNGLVVHQPSAAVAGYVSGQLVRRGPDMVECCDDYSRELGEMVCDLFSEDGYELRPELKRKSIWGDALDDGALEDGTLAVFEKIELDPAHRGKGALASIAPGLRATLRRWGVKAAVCMVGSLNDCAIGPKRPSVPGCEPKIRDAYATMGFRRIGITDWMAMVTDQRHPCWDPATHKPPEFPYERVRATVTHPDFDRVLERCVVAATTPPEEMRGIPEADLAAARQLMAADARVGVAAIVAADPSRLFDADGHTVKSIPAKLLHEILSNHERLWAVPGNPLSGPIRNLVVSLQDVVAARPPELASRMAMGMLGDALRIA